MCAINIMGKKKGVYHDNPSCHVLFPILWIARTASNMPDSCSCEHDLNASLWSGGLPGSHCFGKEMLDFQRAAWCGSKSYSSRGQTVWLIGDKEQVMI